MGRTYGGTEREGAWVLEDFLELSAGLTSEILLQKSKKFRVFCLCIAILTLTGIAALPGSLTPD